MTKGSADAARNNPSSNSAHDHLSAASLDWSLQHHLAFGDTDLFPRPFEFEVIANHWPDVRAHLADLDLRQHTWSKPRRFLVPKDDLLEVVQSTA